MMTDASLMLNLLADVGARKRVWSEMQESLALKHAPNFTVFDFLRTDELGLSDVIRWMLDPNETHGQRDIFLVLFNEIFQVNHNIKTRSAISKTEMPTHSIFLSSRRIDVHVQCEDFILAIENKPFASWQNNQVRDYLEHLQNQAPNRHCLVLLKGATGNVPADQLGPAELDSLKEERRLIDSDYETLERWVRCCGRECQAPRVRTILEEFSEYLKRVFGGGNSMAESRFIIEPLRNNPDRLAAAFDLISARDELFKGIRVDLINELNSILQVNGNGWKALTDKSGNQGIGPGGEQIFIVLDNEIMFAFVPYISGSRPFIGIRWKSDKITHKLSEETSQRLGRGNAPEPWWPWWRFLEADELGTAGTDLSSVWTAMNDTAHFALKIIQWASAAHKALCTHTGIVEEKVVHL
jgi:hypothetical protein